VVVVEIVGIAVWLPVISEVMIYPPTIPPTPWWYSLSLVTSASRGAPHAPAWRLCPDVGQNSGGEVLWSERIE
jgi:hypothetical protein